VKEAGWSLAQLIESSGAAGPDFGIYSGDDILTLPIMAAGGRGVIAMGANLMPRAYAELTDALLAGDLGRARTLNHRLLPLMQAMTLEVTPIPVKAALAPLGPCARTRAGGSRARSRRRATRSSGATQARWRAARRSACVSATPSPRSAGPSRSSSTSRRPPRPWRTRASPPSAARVW